MAAADVTVIIPVGPGHEDLAHRALASVYAQTVPVLAVTVFDPDGRGAGWARNRGIEQVQTPYLVFLDADDALEPEAVQLMLKHQRLHPDRYIYTDWLEDGTRKRAPDCAWCLDRTRAHLVTVLIRTAWARQGPFDETLPFIEDKEFFFQQKYLWGHEGQRLAQPLIHYSPHGWRSHTALAGRDAQGRPVWSDRYKTVRAEVHRRYEGKPTMGCCVQPSNGARPTNTRQPGDVRAVALWSGNHKQPGPASGRVYRGGNGRPMWVDPADVVAAPHLWRTQ